LEPEKDLVTGEWRKLHNEELNDLNFSTNNFSGHQIENNKTDGACNAYGERGEAYAGF
jgi:hypothetical protein